MEIFDFSSKSSKYEILRYFKLFIYVSCSKVFINLPLIYESDSGTKKSLSHEE